MELTYNQFIVLRLLEKTKEKMSQRSMSKKLDLSLGNINNILNFFQNELLITRDLKITSKGNKLLEKYKVKGAIIMAAGFGERLLPVTLKIPKPLISVNGTIMIENTLNILYEKDIKNITIVVDYLKEQFYYLKDIYPDIKFVHDANSEYNNISSAYVVKDKFESSYVFDADIIIKNKDIINKYEYGSNYVGTYTEKTDDWCFLIKDKYIRGMKIGGINTYLMYGISYFNKEDGKKMNRDLEYVFTSIPGSKELYWDQVPCEFCNRNYNLYVRNFEKDDIIEIDKYSELIEIDPSYKNYK